MSSLETRDEHWKFVKWLLRNLLFWAIVENVLLLIAKWVKTCTTITGCVYIVWTD